MKDRVFKRKWSVWMADSVIEKFPKLQDKWEYDYGVVCTGIMKVYEDTKEEKYFEYIKTNMDALVDSYGNIKFYDISLHNLDYVNNGKILLFLYEKTNDEKYRKAADLLRKQLEEQPRTSEGGFWHKDMYPNQMWLDGLYMGQPFYAQYISMFEDEEKYDDVVLQFSLIEKHLRNADTELYYHGWDESRTCNWANKKNGQSPNYWGRALGWFACALVDSLDYVEGDERRAYLISLVRNLAVGVERFQSEKNGLWYQVLDKENEFGNYPEASCSCMFTYFLLKAVREGYIDGKYFVNAKKAFYAVMREFIEVDDNRLLDLHGTVFVSGLGGGEWRDGSYEYYLSEPKKKNSFLGLGAFMMAAAELEKVE